MTAGQKRGLRRPGLFYRMMMSFIGLFEPLLHLSCRSFIQTASDKYERPLRRGERMRQAFHRFMCRLCRSQERHMDQLHQIAGRLGPRVEADEAIRLPAPARRRIEEAIRQVRNGAGGQPPA
jgi:hypothetical protein